MKHIKTALAVAMLAGAGSSVFAAVSDEQIQALEARIAQLEVEKTQVGVAAPERLRINGFMSAGFTYLDDDKLLYDAGLISQDVDWRNASRAGLQFDMRINDQVNAVTQVLARGSDGYAPTIPLAYIGYRPTVNDEMRIGRQRLPLFLLSEYLDVGYAYPWAKPPLESYGTSFPSNYEGISWIHRINTERWSHEFQAFAGDLKFSFIGGVDADINDVMGLSWYGTYQDWTFRVATAGSNRTSATIQDPGLDGLVTLNGMFNPNGGQMNDAEVTFSGLGLQYDNGSLLMMSEFTKIVADGFYPDTESGYLTVGWRFGKFLPTLTLAETKVTDKSDRYIAALPGMCPGVVCVDDSSPGAGDGSIPFPADTLNLLMAAEQQTATLGMRYDFLPNAAVKFDVSAILDTGDGWGNLTPLDGNGNGSNIDEQLQLFGAKPDTPVMAYRLSIDVTF